MYKMPLAWFHELFTNARDKAVRPGVLADLVQSYVDYIIDGTIAGAEDDENGEEEVEIIKSTKKEVASQEEKEDFADVLEKATEGQEEVKDDSSDKGEGDEQTDDAKKEEGDKQDKEDEKEEQKEESEEKADKADESESGETDDKKQEDKESQEVEETANADKSEPIAKEPVAKETDVDEIPTDTQIAVALETIIPEIPENILMADYISPHWALRVLKIAIANECKCTDAVRKLVSRVVYRLAPEDLVELPDEMLIEIVRESCKDGGDGSNHSNAHQGVACALVDTYLAELSARDKLTVDTFNKMVDVVPNEYRFSHDTLFQVLESLLKSGEYYSRAFDALRYIFINLYLSSVY